MEGRRRRGRRSGTPSRAVARNAGEGEVDEKKQGVGASPAARGRWGCEADFRGLPSLGALVGGSAGVDFFSLSPYFKCKDPSRDSAGVAFTGTC